MKNIKTKAVGLLLVVAAVVACRKSGVGDGNGTPNYGRTIPGEIAFSATTCGTKSIVNVTADSTTTANLETVYVAAAYDSLDNKSVTVARFAENQGFTNAKFIRYMEEGTYKFHGDPSAEGGTKYWPKQADPHYYFYASNIELEHTLDTVPDSAVFVRADAKNSKDIVCTYSAYDPAKTNWKKENTLTMHHIFSRVTDVTVSAPDDGKSAVSGLRVTFVPVFKGTYYLRKGNVDVSEQRDGIEKMKIDYKAKGREGWDIDLTLAPENPLNLLDSSCEVIDAGGKVTTHNDFYLVPGEYVLRAEYMLTKGGSVPVQFVKEAKVQIVRGLMNRIKTTLPKSDVEEIVFLVEVNQWHNYDINIPSSDWNDVE